MAPPPKQRPPLGTALPASIPRQVAAITTHFSFLAFNSATSLASLKAGEHKVAAQFIPAKDSEFEANGSLEKIHAVAVNK